MISRNTKLLMISSLLGMLLALPASANLIVNGGFEEPATGAPIGGGNGWAYYDAENINGWNGDNLELWIGRNPDAYEGDYHAELNAHGANGSSSEAATAWSITQTFNTVANQSYNLFFAYSARRGTEEESSEAFRVSIEGATETFDYVINDHTTAGWLTFAESFIAAGTSATLTFTSIFPESRTVGNFLDDVRVTVPEPSSIAILALGLVGLGISRKRTNKPA